MRNLNLTVQNDQLTPLLERVLEARNKLVEEMMGPNASEPKARSATVFHVMLTSIARQLREHQTILAHLEEEAKKRK